MKDTKVLANQSLDVKFHMRVLNKGRRNQAGKTNLSTPSDSLEKILVRCAFLRGQYVIHDF